MTRSAVYVSACALLGGVGPQALAQNNPLREVYFGDIHIHTSYSPDAWVFGNRVTDPGDAYKYFKGEPIKHPLGFEIKIDTPLDFAGVTDHSEYLGVVKLANDPSSPINRMPAATPLILRNDSQEEVGRVIRYLVGLLVRGEKVQTLLENAHTAWEKNIEFANKANEPGKFTAFCSYEWTSTPNNSNLHRNIFFKDCAHVPAMPFSALDSANPSALWTWMDGQRKAGNDLLAISHNANLSDGRMYPTEIDINGRPIDRAYAEDRMRNEPLIEIKQIKGTSETHPLLSPTDEFANFEILTFLLGGPEGRIPHVIGSYARQALKDGLALEDTKGFNPYRFGFGAASDAHNTGAPYRQDNFFGGHGAFDGTIQARMSGTVFGAAGRRGVDVRLLGAGGLTGVWAEDNTRESIFNGMKRKETFAVSGPRIRVRFFGGWNYADTATIEQRREFWKFIPDWIKDRDWVNTAYAQGVPMGGDMTPRPTGDKAPSFAVWAVKDPTSGNLDRIQIIKGWTKSGQSFEKIFDVAWAGDRDPDKWTGVVPPIGSTVVIERGTYTNDIGAVELKTVWTDPEFDPSLPAFYYARVLEIPTPRWTTIQAAQLGIAPPDVVARTIQERAWSSPIWYTPTAEARAIAKASPTVNDLKRQGAITLDDAQLKALIVGKSPWLQNNVTGSQFEITFSASDQNQGQALVDHVGRNAIQPSAVGNAAEARSLGLPSPYYINNGKIVTVFAGTPIEVTSYKLGDKYYWARSNEFGYVNYEIIPAVKELNPLGPGNPVLR